MKRGACQCSSRRRMCGRTSWKVRAEKRVHAAAFIGLGRIRGAVGAGWATDKSVPRQVGLSRTAWPWPIPGLQPENPYSLTDPLPPLQRGEAHAAARFPTSPQTLGYPLCPDSSSGWYGRTLILVFRVAQGRPARLGQLAATATLSGRGRERAGLGSHHRDPKTVSSNGFW